jgi:heavy metal sensor kinase
LIAWRSLEVRLALWYSLLLFLGYAALGTALWLAVSYAVSSAVNEHLEERLERIVDVVSSDADGPEEVEEELVEYMMALPESHLSRVRNAEGERVFPSEEALPEAEGGGFATLTSEGVPYRVLIATISPLGRTYEVRIASTLESLVRVRERLGATLLLVAPLAFVLCSGGGLFIARRALSPLDRMADTAALVTVGSLSRRLPVPRTGDALERLASTINEMLDRLSSSVHRIEQFSADASHELRTPLTVIRATAELALRHEATREELRADLEEIHRQALRLSELVEVLLALSREGVEGGEVAMSDLDLAELASDVCREFRALAESRGLSLDFEGPERSARVFGNDAALRRMLASLLENALCHTAAGGITVSVAGGEKPELAVADTGEGIPEGELEKIFERFYRVDSSRSRETGGQGLGLAIARRIADLHHAEIAAESLPGQGSRFTVRFRGRA